MKKISAWILSLVLILSLAGCSAQAPAATAAPREPTISETSVRRICASKRSASVCCTTGLLAPPPVTMIFLGILSEMFSFKIL